MNARPDLYPACPAIAEPFARPRPVSRFINPLGHIDWKGLKAECATAHAAAEILASEGIDLAASVDVDALLFAHDIDPAQIAERRADVLAIAAHQRQATRDWNERRRFRSRLASIINIDMDELVEAGVLTKYDKDGRFHPESEYLQKQFDHLCKCPLHFYLRLDDTREAAFFELIEARHRKRPPLTGVPFSDGRA